MPAEIVTVAMTLACVRVPESSLFPTAIGTATANAAAATPTARRDRATDAATGRSAPPTAWVLTHTP